MEPLKIIKMDIVVNELLGLLRGLYFCLEIHSGLSMEKKYSAIALS